MLNCFWSNFEWRIQILKPEFIWTYGSWDINDLLFENEYWGVEWDENEDNGRVNKTYECWYTQFLEVIFTEESNSSLILPFGLILVEIWDEIN